MNIPEQPATQSVTQWGPSVVYRQTDSMVTPTLIRLEPGVVVAMFKLMKLVPAKYVVEKAWREGRIDPKVGIVETSSGTYALGLGLVCAEYGIPFHIVSDPVIRGPLQRRLEGLGGTVEVVEVDVAGASPQALRMEALQRHLQRNPSAFWPRQYDHPDNRRAYHPFADHLLEQVGSEFTLVGSVGSGSSTCGTVERLRETNPDLPLVGVDTFGSVLFGLPKGRRLLRGLGNSIFPENLQHRMFDEVHWVTAADAFYWTRKLHADYGLYLGPTSGASYRVARWLAQRSSKPVVFIAADEGHRYQDTVHDEGWVRQRELQLYTPPCDPIVVDGPAQAEEPWSSMRWARRSLADVRGSTE